MKKGLAAIAKKDIYKIRRLQLISYISLTSLGILTLCILLSWIKG
ncbi:hypothetical protein [Enterococcus rotai]